MSSLYITLASEDMDIIHFQRIVDVTTVNEKKSANVLWMDVRNSNLIDFSIYSALANIKQGDSIALNEKIYHVIKITNISFLVAS